MRGEPCGLGSAGVSRNKKKMSTVISINAYVIFPSRVMSVLLLCLRGLRIVIVLAKTHSIWRHRIETNQRPLVYSKEVVCSVDTQAVISRHVSDAFYFFGIVW